MDRGIGWLLDRAASVTTGRAPELLEPVYQIVGARSARLYVADYALRRLQQVDVDGPVGTAQSMVGTMAGRAFTSGEVTVSSTVPTVVSVPLTDGSERMGLLELDVDGADGVGSLDIPTGVLATLDQVPVAETARRLSASVIEHSDSALDDDATLLLIDDVGPQT